MKKILLIIATICFTQLYAEVKIEDCASIESDSKRLACYDYLVTGKSEASEELQNAENSSQENMIGRRTIPKDSSFGLSKRQRQETKRSPSKPSNTLTNSSPLIVSFSISKSTRLSIASLFSATIL